MNIFDDGVEFIERDEVEEIEPECLDKSRKNDDPCTKEYLHLFIYDGNDIVNIIPYVDKCLDKCRRIYEVFRDEIGVYVVKRIYENYKLSEWEQQMFDYIVKKREEISNTFLV